MNDYYDAPCAQWQEKLAVLPPDTLSPLEQESLEAHMRTCDACNSAQQQYRALSTALQTISTEAPPPGLPLRLLQHWQVVDTPFFPARFFHNRSSVRPMSHKRTLHHPLKRRSYSVGIFVAILLVAIISSSGLVALITLNIGKSPSKGGPSMGPTTVSFPTSLSYTQALTLITDMGVQPSYECFVASSSPQWQPVGQKESFSKNHQLSVSPTYSAPSDWRLKLQKIPGVQLKTFHTSVCQHAVFGTPSPDIAYPITSSQAHIYAQVTFKAPLQTYAAALYSISDLGLGLTDMCYEQAEPGHTPLWQPVGEEQLFAKTQALIVETQSLVTSSQWENQLHTQTGVVSFKIISPHTC